MDISSEVFILDSMHKFLYFQTVTKLEKSHFDPQKITLQVAIIISTRNHYSSYCLF